MRDSKSPRVLARTRGLPRAGMVATLAALGSMAALLVVGCPCDSMPAGHLLPLLASVLPARPVPLRAAPRRAGWGFPVLVGLVAAAGTLVFWQTVRSYEQEELRRAVTGTAERVRAEISARIDEREAALRVVALEWSRRGRPSALEWESDARLLREKYPGLVRMEWIKRGGEPGWRFPPDARGPSLEELLRADPELRERLSEAPRSRAPVMAGPFELETGRTGLRILVPVSLERADGFLSAVFAAEQLFGGILANVAPDYQILVRQDGVEIYRREGTVAPEPRVGAASWSARSLPTVERQMEVASGETWTLLVRPTEALLGAGGTRVSTLVLVSGLVIAFLLGFLLRLQQMASARAAALADANARLLAEIEEHRRADEEIRRLNAELEERVRERTEELARSNADLRQFASFVSHELRQPLGTLSIWCELLETTAEGALDERGRRYLAEIRESTQRMAELVESQLMMATASRAPRRERVDLSELVEEVRREVKPELDRIGARMEIGDLPAVEGDRGQLYRLFRNLADNALKYRRPGVPLVVRVTHHPAGPGESLCRIDFEDNGRGFRPEDAERIFTLYERLQEGPGEGSGMGLALCREIVSAHEGELRAEGRPGEGARFIISLSVQKTAPTA